MKQLTIPSTGNTDLHRLLLSAHNSLTERFGEDRVEFLHDTNVATETAGTFVFHVHVPLDESNDAAMYAAQLRSDLGTEFGTLGNRLLFLVLPGDTCSADDAD